MTEQEIENAKARQILDPNSMKMRLARNIKVVNHHLATPEDPDGMHVTKCVEYTVVGSRHSWRNFAKFEVFAAMNPSIRLEDV